MKSKKLVFGIGLNDSDYVVHKVEKINGRQKTVWMCPFYSRWYDMLKRCYSPIIQKRHPTYQGCTVDQNWLKFSNFKAWMETQDWEDRHLDKDLLINGNKIYSSDKCVFIHKTLNMFTTDRINDRGDCMLGVYWNAKEGKFRSQISNPFTNKREMLGRYSDEIQAHLAWKTRKHELACMLAESEYVDDPRVAEALRTRYL